MISNSCIYNGKVIKIMEFKNHSSFRIKHTVDKQEISLLFKRIGIDWKITQIELPEDLLKEFKKIKHK